MSKNIIVIAVLGFLILIGIGSYNNLVTMDEKVNGAWSEVQNQLKRRNDLIPNLVNTVKGYAKHEQDTFTLVTDARAKIGQITNIDAEKLATDPQLQKQLLEAQQGLKSALSRLLAVAENYPVLKADTSFLRLQDELAGTENRIAVARGRAIKSTKDYNQSIRAFPTVVLANLFGFIKKDYYEASAAETALPIVNF